MERIRKQEKLSALLEKSGVEKYFDTTGLKFEGFFYRKGELLEDPSSSGQYLKMIVNGDVSIYFIREDGSTYSLGFSKGRFLLGDLQFFLKNDEAPCFAEALTDVECLALSLPRYRKILQSDLRFLNLIGTVLAEKLQNFTINTAESQTLEERVINYLKYYCKGGELSGLERTAFRLHCSGRQLQRVLNRLEEQQLVKKCGKGRYLLLPSSE